MHNWIIDEYKHCGVDYSTTATAENYDDQHQKFRNYEKEFTGMLEFLELESIEDKTIVDLGCGTGAVALLAAGKFKTVYAVDISDAMLEKAKTKTSNAHNINYINGGFLTYKHAGEPADLITTKAAFHHLPDFWKQIALLRMNRMLKMGGLLYIHDIVFQFDPQEYLSKIDLWISKLQAFAGDKVKAEIETHIRDEHSTFGWILQGMIINAGFVVEKLKCDDEFVAEYVCRKVKEVDFEEAV